MSTVSTLALFVRLIVSLGLVLGLMWGVATLLRKRGFGPMPKRSARGLDVALLARKPLGRNSSIAVIRAAGQGIVVGITEHQITKLADADLTEIDLEERAAESQWTAPPQGFATPGQAWKAMLENVRNRTVRR
jgi:flagellar protein FliO/FliZ